MAKRDNTNLDEFTKIATFRLVKDDDGKTLKFKKYIFLSSVVSYEDGASGLFDIDGPAIYIVSPLESFYILGDVDEFDKEMNKYISAMRERDSDINSPKGS